MDKWAAEVTLTLDFCRNLLVEYGDHAGRVLTARFAIDRAEADLAWPAAARRALTRTLD